VLETYGELVNQIDDASSVAKDEPLEEYDNEPLFVTTVVPVERGVPVRISAGLASELVAWGSGGSAVNYTTEVRSITVRPVR